MKKILLLVVLLILLPSLSEARRRYKVVWVEEGTGVFRIETVQEEGKPPVTVKKEIMRKVKKYVDEKGNYVVPADDDQYEIVETPSSGAEVPVLPMQAPFDPLEMLNKPGLSFSAGYYSIYSTYSTSLNVVPAWSGNIVFDGFGWQASLTFGEFTQYRSGAKFSLCSFTTSKGINSYMSGSDYARESVTSSVIMGRGEYFLHLTDMFYVNFGVSSVYQDLRTSLETNLPAYVYSGLEARVLSVCVIAGTGLRFPLSGNLGLNAGVEGLYFATIEGMESTSLRFGFAATTGISAVF